MIEESLRTLRPDEAQFVSDALAFDPSAVRRRMRRQALLITALSLAFIAAGSLAWTTQLNVVLRGAIHAVSILGTILCWYFAGMQFSASIRLRRLASDDHHSRCYRSLLQTRQVFVRRMTAVAVVEFVGLEDEGPCFLFDLGGGKCVLLVGDELEPVNNRAIWPSSEFEIVFTPDRGTLIGLFSRGVLLQPLRRIPYSEVPDPAKFVIGATYFDGDLETTTRHLLSAA
jgi:hypothetical protein